MATNPHVWAECLYVRWLDAGSIPNSSLALVELDVGVLLPVSCHEVINGTDPVGRDS